MSEGSGSGMRSNTGPKQATEVVLEETATGPPTVPPNQSSQQGKSIPTLALQQQGPEEPGVVPSPQASSHADPPLDSRTIARRRPVRGIVEQRAMSKDESAVKRQSPPQSSPRMKQAERKIESVLTHVFHEGKKDDVLSCDVVAIYLGSNKSGDHNGLSVFRRNPGPGLQPGKDGHTFPEKRQEPRNLGTQSDGASKKPIVDNNNTVEDPRTWLKDADMLHRALPWSRIMSFGWNVVAQMAQNKKALDLDEAASQILKMLLEKRTEEQRSKPVIFIGHGYGSVIVEKMLFEELQGAEELEEDRKALLTSTAAIILYAPPFSNFDKLITWLHKTFQVSEKVPAGEYLLPTKIWETFFCKTRHHDIATFGFIQKSTEATVEGKPRAMNVGNLDIDWEVDANIENIAWVPSFDNEHFKNICKVISQSTATNQMIRAGKIPDVSKIETLIDKMIERSIDFNFETRRTQPILHIAAGRGLKELVQCLLDSGMVSLDGQDNERNTALHVAVQKGEQEVVEILMERGADSSIKNNTKESVQNLARRRNNVLPQIKSLIKNPPLVKGPAERRELVKGWPRNEDAKRACTETGITIWEIFAPRNGEFDEYRIKPSTIQKLIYEEGPAENPFRLSRGPSSKEALCRWYHVPTNNMAWVHDLFAKLDAGVWPWPSESRRGRFHHGRCMNPEVSQLEKLQRGPGQDGAEGWVIFMPFISYEGSCHQKKIANLIKKASTESEILKFWWEDLCSVEMAELQWGFEEFASGRTRGQSKERSEGRRQEGSEEKEGEEIEAEEGEEEERDRGQKNEGEEKRGSGEQKEECQEEFTHDYIQGKNSQNDTYQDQSKGVDPDRNLTDGHGPDGTDSEGERPNEESNEEELGDEESDEEGSDEEELDEDSAEALTIKGYLNGRNKDKIEHLGFHIRRTLDQSYYYMLEDTSYRDKTQVVSRWARRTWPEKSDHNIIMVDQLWLWFLKGTNGNPDTVITSFPSRQGAKFNRKLEPSALNTSVLRDNIERMVLMDRNRDSIRQTTDLVSRILSVCCNSFNPHEHLEPVNFLQSFESTIGKLEEDESNLFRLFRERAKILHGLNDRHRSYLQDRSVLLKKLLDIRQESKLLKEVKDTLDEIKMIESILACQYEIVQSLENNIGTSFDRVSDLILNTTRKFRAMESHAKEVESELERLFELKQKQANQWEARFAREGAEQASKQGSTVLIFTIVTIIFLPLSFMASFFALGISIFPKQDGENNFKLRWVSGILFGVSFAVSVPFIIIALKIELVANVWSKLKLSTAKYLAFNILKPHANKNNKRVLLWYGRAVRFIAKHDLPYETKGEVEKKLHEKVGPDQPSKKRKVSLMDEENEECADTEEDPLDKDEKELKRRQKYRQKVLLRQIERLG